MPVVRARGYHGFSHRRSDLDIFPDFAGGAGTLIEGWRVGLLDGSCPGGSGNGIALRIFALIGEVHRADKERVFSVVG